MPPPAVPKSAGRPLRVEFEVVVPPGQDPHAVARRIALEQTVELPEELIGSRWIRDFVVGAVSTLVPLGDDLYTMVIDFDLDTTGRQVPQLLNVMFGNISLMPGVCIRDVSGLSQVLPGPKYGITGLRDLCCEPHGPLVCTALKPMGKTASELAAMAHDLALGGVHIVKDDHGLSNQPYAPFPERIEKVAAAVEAANRVTGRTCLYFPHFAPPLEHLTNAVERCVEAGIKGVLVSPFLLGLDVLRFLAAKSPFALMAHPALSGAMFSSRRHGMRAAFLLGKLFRYLGADASIYPNTGGRFCLNSDVCQEINDALRRPHPTIAPAFPVPAGGMALEQLPELRREYGDEVIFLVGGHMLQSDRNLTRAAEKFRAFARGEPQHHIPEPGGQA